ncbi:MAG: O-antigen ligase family protein [Chloroflexi bacterium]|nr:O-antigen ligase family protein [Chloroflexota bacterium]
MSATSFAAAETRAPAQPPLPFGPHGRRAPSPWLLALPAGIVLALLPAMVTGAIVLGAAAAAVLLARPRWALYLLALTVPYQSVYDVKVYGASVTVTEGVVILLLVGWLHQLATGRVVPPRRSAVAGAAAGLLVALLLSTLVAGDLVLSAKELLKWLELMAALLVGTSLLAAAHQRRVMLVWLLAAGASQALLGIIQSVARIGPEHFTIAGVLMRAYGTFEQPNPFGGFLGLSLPLAVALSVFGLPPGMPRRLAHAATATIGVALLLTLSRGAWLGQLAGIAVVVLTASPAARHAVATFGVLLAILFAGLWPILPPALTERAASVVVSAFDLGGLRYATVTAENWAVLERLSQWYAGWQMFAGNPILGVGIGNYTEAYDAYRLDQWPVALGHAHNHYLTIAAEAGILGFAAYSTFWAAVFFAGSRAYRRAPDRFSRVVALGTIGSLAAFNIHNLFDVLFVHGMGVTVGLLLALLHTVHQGSAEAPAQTRAEQS